MLGRRSHARYAVAGEAKGVLRVLTDVAVRSATENELVVVSRDASLVGELVQVHLAEDDVVVPAQVVESRPVIVQGTVRHHVRLAVIASGQRTAPVEAAES